jgi:DNA-binding MarR family transcriptional regulator
VPSSIFAWPANPRSSGANLNLNLAAQRVEPRVARETPEVQAWAQLLRAHSALTRRFSTELLTMHGLTLNGYEVLLYLAHAPERRLRRVDLAESVLLTASGITRLLDGLERAGYVTRATSEQDARVTYAVLTDQGYEKLRSAAPTHVGSIRELFAESFSSDELETLAELLGRLSADIAAPDCEP